MTYRMTRRDATMLIGGSLAAFAVPSAFAEDTFPSKVITLIVPNGPGGPSDIVGRVTAEALGKELNGSVVVENREGAAGAVGTQVVVESRPDGYTLLFSSNTAFSVLPAVRNNLPFDVSRDIAIVGTVARGPEVLVVRASLGVNSVQELIARAKAEPGTLKFASTGTGGVVHMAGEMFKHYAGIDIDAIPYGGGGAAVAAMLSGEIDMMINDLSPMLEQIQSGNLKALAVSNDTRIAALPDTPTFIEVGLPDVVTSSWFAIGAPSKTPPEALQTLSTGLRKVVTSDGFRTALTKFGLEPFDLSQEDAGKFIASELAKWKKLVAEADLKFE
jgi:tripartite-type tricarboxylate transporter receptor subunit TctC